MPHYYFNIVVTEKTHVRWVIIFSGSLRPCSEFPPHHFYHNEFLHSSQLQEYHTAFYLLSIFHSILLSNTTRGYVFDRASTSLQEDTLLIYSLQIYSRSPLAQTPRKPSCLGHYLIYSKSPEGLRSTASSPIR
jgi:hypothetical protein